MKRRLTVTRRRLATFARVRARHFSGGWHGSIGVLRSGFFLSYRTTAGLVRRLASVPAVVALADGSTGVLRRRRCRIDGSMLLAPACLLGRRLTIADPDGRQPAIHLARPRTFSFHVQPRLRNGVQWVCRQRREISGPCRSRIRHRMGLSRDGKCNRCARGRMSGRGIGDLTRLSLLDLGVSRPQRMRLREDLSAGVAQLVERLIRNQQVRGSSPRAGFPDLLWGLRPQTPYSLTRSTRLL